MSVRVVDRRLEEDQEPEARGDSPAADGFQEDVTEMSLEEAARITEEVLDGKDQEGTEGPGEEEGPSVPVITVPCGTCEQDIAEYCNWLPFPGPAGQNVLLRIIPMICPFCRGNVINAPIMPFTPSPIQRPAMRGGLNRAMRRHPEAFGLPAKQ